MLFQEQQRSLSSEQRDRFRKLNPETRQSIRAYVRISGDRLAPFVVRHSDPYGIPLPDAESYSFQVPSIQRNRFIGREILDFGVIRNLKQTDALRFSRRLSYQVERGSGDRAGYLFFQYTSFGMDLLAIVVGENPALRSLSQVDRPLSHSNFLS